uniref:Rab-like protein 3 n=1 Tax=Scophthalmus maximus TaxID=52904 RepID=A0A8D2ZL04_SCOMX
MASLDRVKVLVLGDSGVGKSSLVHLLCQNQVLGNPSWTVGCSVDVRAQDYKEGTPEEKTYYIELWDVGGSVGCASSIKSTRAVFYNSVNGIILVHDLTNKKSSQNLYRWSLEALNKDSSPTGVIVSNGSDYDREQFAENPVPLLLIGTKFDQIPDNKRNEVLTRTAFLSEDFNAEEINLDCTNPRYLAAGTSNAVKLSRFFDKVIEKRYFTRDPSQVSFTFQGFIHVFSKITLTKQNVIIIFDEGDLSRQNQNSIVTDEEQAVILNNTFLILSLQMTGFTDRKRFNFKSLHYD